MPAGRGAVYEGYIMPPGHGEPPIELPPPPIIRQPPPMKPVVTGSAMLGMFYGIDHWANPLLKATKRQRRYDVFGWWSWTEAQIARFVSPGVKFVASEMSTGLGHVAAAPAGLLNTFAWRWRQTQVMLAHFADTTAFAVERIVHVKIPQRVRTELHPVKTQVRRLRVGEIRLADDLNGVRFRVNRDLPRHGKQRVHNLETEVFGRLRGRYRSLTRRVDAQGREVRRHETILGKISWIARFAGPVPLVLYAFRRLRIQSLLCRNTKAFTQEVCAMPSGMGRSSGRLLRELAETFMSFIGALSVVAFAVEVYELLNVRIPGLGHSALHYIQDGITEVEGLATADYLGPVDFPLDLHASDYLA